MTKLIQIQSYTRDIKGRLPRIFEMKRVYHDFKTIKNALKHTHSLSNPSKLETYGYSISALECKIGGKLHEIKGSVCEFCYARKGHYVFKVVKNAHKIRLNKINNDSLWVDAIIFILNRKKLKGEKLDIFRWHDSGDIQSPEHLSKIAEIAEQTPQIKHWLPTKESVVVREWIKTHDIPDNLNIRISASMVNGDPVHINGCTTSIVVTKDMLGKMSGIDCPIYSDSNHGKTCGDCRACYDDTVDNINYQAH
tara:strand:- start:852 stop:1604 length:753 start_codon:yes stop_codon:yes gene_type:complete